MAVASPLMAELQPENYPAIQDFLHWKDDPEIHKKGCGGPANTVGTRYISKVSLIKKLTQEKIEALLHELFRDVEQPAPDAEIVMRYYLRPFAILLCADFGRMISYFVEYLSLRDHLLPFAVESRDFPKSTRRDLYQAFCKEQWQFCPVQLDKNMDYVMESDYIIPITYKEKIGDGGSAQIYKIKIDEAYNSLQPSQPIDAPAPCVNPNIFVLKTYQTSEAKIYFETERSAFKRLRYGNLPPGNIIKYYASFERNGTYNIILEYADRGTLNEYLKDTDGPTGINEIMTFWKCFLPIFHGLTHIHGTRGHGPSQDEPNFLLGWHHDISPDNILVVSKTADSPYECEFKIADLGLSHFRRHSSSLSDVTDEDKYGSNAYAAPETYRSSDSEESQKTHLQVSQGADIWSMGCILSEVITWVTEGRKKLRDYKRRRVEEIGRTFTRNEDRFHCNGEVLETVRQLHADFLQNRRVHDHITPMIVERLVHYSVVIDHHSRASAHALFTQSSRILEEAQERLDCERTNGPATYPYYTVSYDRVRDKKKRLPPNLPLRSASTSSIGTLEAETDDCGPAQSSGQWMWSSGSQQRGTHSGWVQNGVVQEPIHNFMGHDRNRKHTIPSERPEAQHQQPHFSHRRLKHVSSPPVLSSMRRQQYTPSSAIRAQMEIRSQKNASGITADGDDNSQASYLPSRSEQNRHSATSPGESVPRRSTTEGMSHLLGTQNGTQFVESGLPSHHDEGFPSPYSPALNNRPHPQMSVNEGLEIKRAKGYRQNTKYPDQDLFETLDAVLRHRDHVFLVDNAESMGQHRDQVRNVLELLSSLTSRYDPDGLDLFFSTESGKHRPKNNAQVLRLFDAHSAHGLPDMRERFASIIESYQAQIGKRNTISRLRHYHSTPSRGPRRLSLYVLTNGVWQPECNLITEIRTLVSLLQEHKLTNKHIGIQFIRFGNDAKGKRRLQKLDSGLGLELDIIDTTPAEGNVWKMLLGGVNDWFDDDHDENTDEERELRTPP